MRYFRYKIVYINDFTDSFEGLGKVFCAESMKDAERYVLSQEIPPLERGVDVLRTDDAVIVNFHSYQRRMIIMQVYKKTIVEYVFDKNIADKE